MRMRGVALRWACSFTGMVVLLGLAAWRECPAGTEAITLQIAQATTVPAGTPITLRGTITVVDGQDLTVASTSGEARVRLAGSLVIIGVVGAKLSDIRPGAYVGSGARRQADGIFRALEVHIFHESMRGTGEGHRPMAAPETTMTNAAVEEVVERVEGSVMTLKYKEGTVRIVVGPEAPIVRFVPGDRGLLKPGAGVVVRGIQAADGSISTSRINVGLNGLMP